MGASRSGAAFGLLLGALALAPAPARAQIGMWQERTPAVGPPGARSLHAMAYDSARGRTVMFGGSGRGDTWEWDGGAWTLVASTGPSPRNLHAMAYDSARGVTVLFGGTTGGGETWEWDGGAWTQVASTGPSPRSGHAMAYDSARGVTVLFGGSPGGGETWEWDGSAWSLRAQTGPTARTRTAMAYDSARGVTVLYGGYIGGFGESDTWEWDGATWTRRGAAGPGVAGVGRYGHAMAYDDARGVTVLFGGSYDGTQRSELWQTVEWDGTTWARRGPLGPSERQYLAMAYDSARGRTVLFGGDKVVPITLDTIHGDTWEWDGAAWASDATSPPARESAAMAYDDARERTVLFGGGRDGTFEKYGDTWEWDGSAWSQRATAGPAPRHGSAMAYDEARAEIVLFGGFDASYMADTWSWDGKRWVQVASTGPPARAFGAMAYDGARRRVVLFGGGACDTATCMVHGDTWEWDGTSWSQVASSGPVARAGHAMAWDRARGRTVLYGGVDGTGDLDDTWEWDGSAWTEAATTGPGARESSGMIHDAARGRSVLFGGYALATNSYFGDTWEWDGTTWVQTASSGPYVRDTPAMAFDAARGRALLFGGSKGFAFGDTWEYSTASAPPPDAGTPDAGAPDGAEPDAAEPDATAPDAGALDGSSPDAAVSDASELDGTAGDAVTPDAGADARDAAMDGSRVMTLAGGGCSCSCRVGGADVPPGFALTGLVVLLLRRPGRRAGYPNGRGATRR